MKLETSKGNMHPQEQQRLKAPHLRLPGFLSKAQRETGKAPRRSKALLPVTRGTDQSPGSWPHKRRHRSGYRRLRPEPGQAPEEALEPRSLPYAGLRLSL